MALEAMWCEFSTTAFLVGVSVGTSLFIIAYRMDESTVEFVNYQKAL